jgi:hypothetical protein
VISRSTIERAAGLRGWPRVSSLVGIEGGEADWRRVLYGCPPPAPAEEAAMLAGLGLPFLTDLLVATPAAWQRLESWLAAGARVPSADDLVRRLKFLGDTQVRDVVLKALHENIPPPAADYLLGNFLFMGTGWSTGGWCVRTAAPRGPVLSVVLLNGASRDPATVLDYMLHEGSHGWLLCDPPEPIPAESLYNEMGAALLAAAKRSGGLRELLDDEGRDERLADALACEWGGKLSCTDLHDREGTLRELRQLQQLYGGQP